MKDEEKHVQRAWCEYCGIEYVDGLSNPLPSDNFAAGYRLGHREGKVSLWHCVDNELPEIDEDVIVIYSHPYSPGNKEIDVAYFNGEKWYTCSSGAHIRPTHWLPIPEIPKNP